LAKGTAGQCKSSEALGGEKKKKIAPVPQKECGDLRSPMTGKGRGGRLKGRGVKKETRKKR